MTAGLILASGSEIRQNLLRNAGVSFTAMPVKIDEAAIREAMVAEDAHPRDIADQLAEFKARKAVQKQPDAVVLGCDQVLAIGRDILAKPCSVDEAKDQITRMSGRSHQLLSAAVIYEQGQPVWRHVGVVKLHMRQVDPGYLDDYLAIQN